MATGWGMSSDEARIAWKLGGWVEVQNDDGPPSKAQIVNLHKKSALVRFQGSSMVRDVKFTHMRPQRAIRLELEKESKMPPDIAPRPLPKTEPAPANGMSAELSGVIGFLSKIKEAQAGLAKATESLAKAEGEVVAGQAMWAEAVRARDAAKALVEKYSATLKSIPPDLLELMK